MFLVCVIFKGFLMFCHCVKLKWVCCVTTDLLLSLNPTLCKRSRGTFVGLPRWYCLRKLGLAYTERTYVRIAPQLVAMCCTKLWWLMVIYSVYWTTVFDSVTFKKRMLPFLYIVFYANI